MPQANWQQTSFLGGQWTQFAQGRFDDPDYPRAMGLCLNSYPIEAGPWTRRPGFRLVCPTRSGAPGRGVAFDYRQNSPYVLEFTDAHIRWVRGYQLAVENNIFSVTTISTGTPAVAQISTATGWAANDQIVFVFGSKASAAAYPTLANRQFRIIPTDTTHFQIFDPVTNLPISGTDINFSVSGVQARRVKDIASPYINGDWANIRAVQNQLNSLLLHTAYQPQLLTATNLGGTNFADFSLAPAVLLDGPYLDPPIFPASPVQPGGTTGAIPLVATDITPINNGQGFLPTDVGRSIRLQSTPGLWNAATVYGVGAIVTSPLDGFAYQTTTSSTISGGSPPPLFPQGWLIAPSQQRWSWGVITGVTNNTTVTVQMKGQDLTNTNLVYAWRLGVYSKTTGWPTCGCFHEGRFWLGGAIPNRWDASVSNQLLNFAPTAPDGSVLGSSGISYTFNSSDVNDIFWMEPSQEGIVCGTQGGEWLIQSTANNLPITAATAQAHRTTKYGCANIEPRRTGLSTAFVHRYQRQLHELLPDAYTGKYFAPNLSQFTKGLTSDGIAEIAYQEELTPIIWMRTNGGNLVGTTYRRLKLSSAQPPEFNGWHRHQLGSGRLVESICVGASGDSTLDALTMVTNDPSTGTRWIEVSTPLFDEGAQVTNAAFVDAHIVPPFGTTVTHDGKTWIRFFGLWQQIGQLVSVFCCGLDCGDFLVGAGGFVDVPYGAANGGFTLRTLQQTTANPSSFSNDNAVDIDAGAMRVPCTIGFTYTSQGQTLRPATAAQTGSATGPGFGKIRRDHKFAMLLASSIGLSVGGSFDRMRPVLYRTAGNIAYGPNQPFDGLFGNQELEDDYTLNGYICWQVTRPWPTTICAVGGFLMTQDKN